LRVVYITAGAGGMYCGACCRDANLAHELVARGCDVQFIPLYTPLKLERDAPPGTTRTFFGGINVYLQQHIPIFRHTPRPLDRLLDSSPLLNWASKFAVQTRAEALGPMTLSMLRGEQGRQRKELERLLNFLEAPLRPDVVNITNMLLSGIVPALKERLPVPVVCTVQGEDDFVQDMPEPYRSQVRDVMRKNAREIELFISPSGAYVTKMAEFLDVPRDTIKVVPTGIDVDKYPSASSRPRDPFTVGYLSRITPGKGLDVLVEAVAILVGEQKRNVRLNVAGQIVDRKFWRRVRAAVKRASLTARFSYSDAPDLRSKVAFLQGCSAFAQPGRSAEIRATAAIEAMAVGVPVVVPDLGVFPEIIQQTGGGVLFPPGDAERMAEELAALMDNPEKADALGLAGRRAIRIHYSAAAMADRTLELYAGLRRRGE